MTRMRDLSAIYEQKRKGYIENATKKSIPHGANVKQVDGFYQESKVHQFTLSSDEHVEPWGGTDKAPSPLQYFFSSLGFSINNQILIHSALFGAKIDSLDTLVEGNFDPAGCYNIKGRNPRVITIVLTFKISSDASPKLLKKVIDTAAKGDPVYQTLKDSVKIKRKIEQIRFPS